MYVTIESCTLSHDDNHLWVSWKLVHNTDKTHTRDPEAGWYEKRMGGKGGQQVLWSGTQAEGTAA